MRKQRGLILVELIAVIVLIGIIASFTGFFLYTGINGYLKNKNNTEGALNAQTALDRISLELRDLKEVRGTPDTTPPDLSLSYTYKSETLTGTRILKYDSNTKTIAINIANQDFKLLENVYPCSLDITSMDLNNDGSDEVAYIEVGFNVNDIGMEFKTKIFPRHMVEKTW